MRARSRKPDSAQNALRFVEQAIAEKFSPKKRILRFPERKKDPEAVAPGKMGGMKGGPARTMKLTPEQRKEIAQRAAKARWAKASPNTGRRRF